MISVGVSVTNTPLWGIGPSGGTEPDPGDPWFIAQGSQVPSIDLEVPLVALPDSFAFISGVPVEPEGLGYNFPWGF